MKNLYIPFFVILFLMVYMPSELVHSQKQMVTEMLITTSDSTFRYTYAYDDLGHKVLETQFYQVNADWSRVAQTELQYQGNLCVKQIELKFTNATWVQNYVIDYVYENEKLINETHTSFNGAESTPLKKLTYSYLLNNLTSKKIYSWSINDWKLAEENAQSFFGDGRVQNSITTLYNADTIKSQFNNEYLYDDSLKLVNQLLREKSSDGLTWNNLESITWIYAQNSSTLLSQRNKKWSTEMSKWETSQKIDFEYDSSNKLIAETYQAWKLMFWEDVAKYSYEYNQSGNLLKTRVLLPIYKQWRTARSIAYSNFTSDKPNLVESKFDFWGGTQDEPVSTFIPFIFNDELTIKNAKRIEITRGIYTGTVTAINSKPTNSVSIYPNPSDGVFYINTHQEMLIRWGIYDLNGRIIKRSNETVESNVLDLTGLDAGIYFVNVVTDKSSRSLKLIKK